MVFASSHARVLMNHCGAQLRTHTKATTFSVTGAVSGGGPGEIGTASNQMRAIRHTGPHLQVHSKAYAPVAVVSRVPLSRGPKEETLNKRGVCLVPGRWGWYTGVRDGLETSVALCSCCYCCLGYCSQYFFVAISTS